MQTKYCNRKLSLTYNGTVMSKTTILLPIPSSNVYAARIGGKEIYG